MNVQNTVQVLKLLPSVSYTTAGPGFGQIYMRGVASGGDGNHSGSLPSVGIYLDEEPITTIQGPLDLHMYDIQRVEALAGPQGTLYGASSQSGTIRYHHEQAGPERVFRQRQRRGQCGRPRRHRLPDRRLRQPAADRVDRLARRRLGQAGCRLHRQRARHADLSVLGHHRRQRRRRAQELQLRRYARRPHGAEDRPQRRLDDHADVSPDRASTRNGILAYDPKATAT